MRCVVVGVLSSYQQHAAPLIVGRHWEEQSTTWAESVEPGWERMRGPCTGDDRVCWIERSLGPISVQDRDLMPMLESLASLFASAASISMAVTLPVGPTSSAAIPL